VFKLVGILILILNTGFHLFGRHMTGSRDIRNENGTVDHLIIECQSALTLESNGKCPQLHLKHTVEHILSDQMILCLMGVKLDTKI
jgi:hypothetical protein